jgi:orotate phosphoribosyltransferase
VVEAILTVVDREEGGSEKIREAGYPFFRLYTAGELLAATGRFRILPPSRAQSTSLRGMTRQR